MEEFKRAGETILTLGGIVAAVLLPLWLLMLLMARAGMPTPAQLAGAAGPPN